MLVIQVDPFLSKLVILTICIILLGLVLKLLKQPYILAYILAGIFLGPSGLEIVTDESVISNLGSFGLVLLLFFVGMEISLPGLIANWKISVFGTAMQVVFSVLAVWLIGYYLDWALERVIMIGFAISLSSTAVVIKLLQDSNQTNTKTGQNVIGILLAQDIIIVPMLITLNYLSGHTPETSEVIKQLAGGVIIIAIILFVVKKGTIRVPYEGLMRLDHEIQVFVAFAFCFGFAVITALLGLSGALGAFVAGILVSSTRATEWVRQSLHSFRVVFVALFFVSVGMLINVQFILNNVGILLLLVFIVFIANNLINAVIMRIFGENWRSSFYAGAILSQIGEFSFILGASGYAMGIISDYTYQLTISIISISLLLSPLWINLIKTINRIKT